MSNFYSKTELLQVGFRKVGQNNKISKKVIFHQINGTIGKNVRIDDNVIIKGKIKIGSYVHIANNSILSGAKSGIKIGNFSGVSFNTLILCGTDDFFGDSFPEQCVKLIKKSNLFFKSFDQQIVIGNGCSIGARSTLLAGTIIKNFSSIGSHSLLFLKTVNTGTYFSNFNLTKPIIKKRNLKSLQKKYNQLKKYL